MKGRLNVLRDSLLGDAARMIACLWGMFMVIGGVFASLGLLLWPWSDRPLQFFFVGAAGVLVSLAGACIIIWEADLK